MLKLIIIGFEDFLFKDTNFIFGSIQLMSFSLKKKLTNEQLKEINEIKLDNSQNLNKVLKKICESWDLSWDSFFQQFLGFINKQFISIKKSDLSNQWIEIFKEIENRQFQTYFISQFTLPQNLLNNLQLFDELFNFATIQSSDDKVALKNQLVNIVKNSNVLVSETLLLTNRNDLIEIIGETGIKVLSSNENLPKALIKQNKVFKIEEPLNLESWIYIFFGNES